MGGTWVNLKFWSGAVQWWGRLRGTGESRGSVVGLMQSAEVVCWMTFWGLHRHPAGSSMVGLLAGSLQNKTGCSHAYVCSGWHVGAVTKLPVSAGKVWLRLLASEVFRDLNAEPRAFWSFVKETWQHELCLAALWEVSVNLGKADILVWGTIKISTSLCINCFSLPFSSSFETDQH